MPKVRLKVWLEEKNIFSTEMFLKLAFLPPLDHKRTISTLGYPIASKLEDIEVLTHTQTHTRLYKFGFLQALMYF